MLRHGENDRWAPERDGEQSICLELAFNAAVTRRVLSDTCVPSDVYTCLKLQVRTRIADDSTFCCAMRAPRSSATRRQGNI